MESRDSHPGYLKGYLISWNSLGSVDIWKVALTPGPSPPVPLPRWERGEIGSLLPEWEKGWG